MKFTSSILLLLSLILYYPSYLYLTYIDNTITKGTAFGFPIGGNKQYIYKILPRVIQEVEPGEMVFIQIKSMDFAICCYSA